MLASMFAPRVVTDVTRSSTPRRAPVSSPSTGETSSFAQKPHATIFAKAKPGSHASTASTSAGSCSIRTSSTAAWQNSSGVNWNEVVFARQIRPFQGYAHRTDDIYLLSRFFELAEMSDVAGEAVKLLLRSLKLLRLCDYSVEDISSILAHASTYWLDTKKQHGCPTDMVEVGNVLVLLIFLAHTWVQDECCPLRVWHQHLFKDYCTVKTLNMAVMRLMQIRNHKLRVDEDELSHRYASLLESQKLRLGVAETPRLDQDKSVVTKGLEMQHQEQQQHQKPQQQQIQQKTGPRGCDPTVVASAMEICFTAFDSIQRDWRRLLA